MAERCGSWPNECPARVDPLPDDGRPAGDPSDRDRRSRGDPGIRDRGALESALAQPKQQFGGQYVHESLPAMAAAYAFHVSRNHPFLDGNKRASLAAMLIFLLDNGLRLTAIDDEVYQMIYDLAAGAVTKEALAKWIEAHCSRIANE